MRPTGCVLRGLLLCVAGCGGGRPVFLEAPSVDAEGWAIAVHRANGTLEVTTREDWTKPFEFDATDGRSVELLAYASFEFPIGHLRPPDEERPIPRALPSDARVFRAEFEGNDSPSLEETPAPSPALAAFRYGAASDCSTFEMKVTPLSMDGGNTSGFWLDDGSAVFGIGPTFHRVTSDGAQSEFTGCGIADHYVAARRREDGTFLVLTQAPVLTAVLRFDVADMRCEVESSRQPPFNHRTALDSNQSGDPSAPIYALTSSGALYRLTAEGEWNLEHAVSHPPDRTFGKHARLVQFAPGRLAGGFDDPSLFLFSQAEGGRTVPLPEPPSLVQTPIALDLAFDPEFGLVVSTDWGPIYRLEPFAPAFGERWQDFGIVTPRVLPFRGGYLALVKEGPMIEVRDDEVCLPGTSVSAGALLAAIARDDAIVALYREEPRRVARWLEVD